MKKVKIGLAIILLSVFILSGNSKANESSNANLSIDNTDDKITKTEITYSDRKHGS